MLSNQLKKVSLMAAGLGFLAAVPIALSITVSGVAVAQDNSGPTLITPRVGGPVQEGTLPQTPEAEQPTPEEVRRLLRIRLLNIEGGDAYVRQACGDPTWQEDYKAALSAVDVSDQPAAIQAFKDGWEESKLRLGSEIASCEALLGTSN